MIIFGIHLQEHLQKSSPKSLIYINIPGEDSGTSLLNDYIFLNFEVFKKTDTFRFGNGNGIRSNNLAPVGLFSNYILTTSSGKHLEDISHAHIVSLMYKLTPSAKDSEDVSIIGFNSDRGRRRVDIAPNKNIKGKYLLGNMLKDAFGFADDQKEATNGLGYKLTLPRNKDDGVLDKTLGICDARFKIELIHWYVTHRTPCIQQQSILSKQIISKTPIELRYIE